MIEREHQSGRKESAVHVNGVPRDILGFVTGKEYRRDGDFLRLAIAALRNQTVIGRSRLESVHGLRYFSEDRPRGDGVYCEAVVGQLDPHDLGQQLDTRL